MRLLTGPGVELRARCASSNRQVVWDRVANVNKWLEHTWHKHGDLKIASFAVAADEWHEPGAKSGKGEGTLRRARVEADDGRTESEMANSLATHAAAKPATHKPAYVHDEFRRVVA